MFSSRRSNPNEIYRAILPNGPLPPAPRQSLSDQPTALYEMFKNYVDQLPRDAFGDTPKRQYTYLKLDYLKQCAEWMKLPLLIYQLLDFARVYEFDKKHTCDCIQMYLNRECDSSAMLANVYQKLAGDRRNSFINLFREELSKISNDQFNELKKVIESTCRSDLRIAGDSDIVLVGDNIIRGYKFYLFLIAFTKSYHKPHKIKIDARNGDARIFLIGGNKEITIGFGRDNTPVTTCPAGTLICYGTLAQEIRANFLSWLDQLNTPTPAPATMEQSSSLVSVPQLLSTVESSMPSSSSSTAEEQLPTSPPLLPIESLLSTLPSSSPPPEVVRPSLPLSPIVEAQLSPQLLSSMGLPPSLQQLPTFMPLSPLLPLLSLLPLSSSLPLLFGVPSTAPVAASESAISESPANNGRTDVASEQTLRSKIQQEEKEISQLNRLIYAVREQNLKLSSDNSNKKRRLGFFHPEAGNNSEAIIELTKELRERSATKIGLQEELKRLNEELTILIHEEQTGERPRANGPSW